MRKLIYACVAVLAAATGPQAHAAWYQATSKHFVIYADEDPRELASFATRLERFDQVVRFVRRIDDPPVGDGNRLTVFVLPNVGAVQDLMGGDSFVQGFYIGRASGCFAFVPRKASSDDAGALTPETIFFHEYAHHVMFQTIERPLPPWVIEGFAEFMATVRFEDNGDIGIGAVPKHRAYGLFDGDHLSLQTLLSANYSRITVDQRESVYGLGWLLIHYLTFEPSRAGQLERYANLLASGTPALDAARSAFGDLKQLDRELDSYLNRKRLKYVRLAGAKFQAGQIAVRPLSPGAAKVILLRAKSKKGVDDNTAGPLAGKVRSVERQFPGDELVELTLAEAELDAGHVDAAEAAADRTLQANPKNTKAMIFKGRAIAENAAKLTGSARDSGFRQARALFVDANKLDTEDPEPLAEFYRSYVSEGIAPTANAIAGLHYASDLAPQDQGLRMSSALRYLQEGKVPEAKRSLMPIAYDPHGDKLAELARGMIEKIDDGHPQDALAAALSGASKDFKMR